MIANIELTVDLCHVGFAFVCGAWSMILFTFIYFIPVMVAQYPQSWIAA